MTPNDALEKQTELGSIENKDLSLRMPDSNHFHGKHSQRRATFIPKQAMFPSRPMYLRSHLAASISVGSLSVMSSMAKTAFWRNSALSSKLILASKQTTGDGRREGGKNQHRRPVWTTGTNLTRGGQWQKRQQDVTRKEAIVNSCP